MPSSAVQKLWPEMPKRALSGLLRRSGSAGSAGALANALDAGLLQQLGPIAASHPYKLEAQARVQPLASVCCRSIIDAMGVHCMSRLPCR